MRNSTGSPLFSDFKSDLSRVVRSRPLVKGNEDAGYEGVDSPGITVIAQKSIPGEELMAAILDSWRILIFIGMSLSLSGIVMWALVRSVIDSARKPTVITAHEELKYMCQ